MRNSDSVTSSTFHWLRHVPAAGCKDDPSPWVRQGLTGDISRWGKGPGKRPENLYAEYQV